MSSCCCSYVTCADARGDSRTLQSEEEPDPSRVRMDIALLKEQYNSIRDQQRRGARVLRFRSAQMSEEISETPVDVVPVCLRSPAPEPPAQFVVDSSGGPWRTHLDAHRLTHAAEASEHRSAVSSEDSSSESLSEDSNRHLENGRKMSAPVLSRQLSFGSYRSAPAGSGYYPFPQRKSPRKSETARRLGLYASL